MYTCPERGCSRSFKRPEHLSRHRLNREFKATDHYSKGMILTYDKLDQPRKIYQCQVCRKDFVRLDLLQRHSRRHDRGMAYRNSGGYSTSGRPDSSMGEESPETPLSAQIEPRVELRGHSAVIDESGPDTGINTPVRGQVETPAVIVELSDPTELDVVQQLNQESRLGERSDVEYLTFFDGSNDATGLTQDIDWLFGVGPWDASTGLRGFNIRTPTTELPAWSPASETSQGSAFAVPQLESVYMIPREKVLSALTSLPADILASSFFEVANLELFMQNYWEGYNPHFSLLHRPTFSVEGADPLLLVALLTLGATLSPDQDHYRVAEKIHETIRWLIFTASTSLSLFRWQG